MFLGKRHLPNSAIENCLSRAQCVAFHCGEISIYALLAHRTLSGPRRHALGIVLASRVVKDLSIRFKDAMRVLFLYVRASSSSFVDTLNQLSE